MEDLLKLKDALDNSGIFLSFSGPISQNLMVELGAILKNQMEMAEADTSTILKVFSVLVEQSQNIIHHSAETYPKDLDNGEKLMFGTIAVGFKDDKYFVMGGNKIKKDQENELQSKLHKVQKLDKDQLKDLYRQQRKAGISSEEGNAGLGLIDLARKASEPIQYDFVSIDDDYSFFTIRTLI